MPDMPGPWLCAAALWTLFFVYCVGGWVVESTWCSVPARHFINRGFLNGPYIPIYGAGCMMAALLLSGLREHPALLFLAAGTLCCLLEYVTSWVMERMFHARWWDYSERPLNLNGRIWAGGFVEFGAGCGAVVMWVHPVLTSFVEGLPHGILVAFALVSAIVFFTDVAITNTGLAGLRSKMDYLRAETEQRLATLREQLPSMPELHGLGLYRRFDEYVQQPLRRRIEAGRAALPSAPSFEELAEAFAARLSGQERRILRAFPGMRPSHYRDALTEVLRELQRITPGPKD